MEEKAKNIMREIILPLFGIIIFPLFSIRALMWNWFFWLSTTSEKIKDYKRKL